MTVPSDTPAPRLLSPSLPAPERATSTGQVLKTLFLLTAGRPKTVLITLPSIGPPSLAKERRKTTQLDRTPSSLPVLQQRLQQSDGLQTMYVAIILGVTRVVPAPAMVPRNTAPRETALEIPAEDVARLA